jgi:sugar phosphate isomerase/epimerase
MEHSSQGLLAQLDIALGIELYTVEDLLKSDFTGTLNALAGMGYTDVEAPNFRGRDAAEWRQAFADAGLRCLCVHATIGGLKGDFARELDFAAEVGTEQIVCIIPTSEALTADLDYYRRAADDLAEMGQRARGHPVTLGFHPNYVEMRSLGDLNPFELMMARMPANLVHLQLDVANAARAGMDPVACIRRHAARISTLHVKDLLPDRLSGRGVAASIEMGEGALPWRDIFEEPGWAMRTDGRRRTATDSNPRGSIWNIYAPSDRPNCCAPLVRRTRIGRLQRRRFQRYPR